MTAAEVTASARTLASGGGAAGTIYERALGAGRFEPEAFGLSPRSVEAWRGAFTLTLPEVRTTHAEGDTVKAVLVLDDGLEVECVRVPMEHGRFTLCISSQVGCRLGCGFCETAKMGLLRNLSASEIVAQVVVARTVLRWDVHNVVFMGMGEPLENVENLMRALRVLNDDKGLAFGQQRLNVCTAGHVPGLLRLSELGWKRLGISVSLNAATDDKRNKLMPVNRRFPLRDLQEALIAYRPRKRFVYRVSYCLLPGLNDTVEDAAALAAFVRPIEPALVNVIPYNPGTRPLTRAPDSDEVARFLSWVRAEGVFAKERATKGRSQMAACGQLGNLELRKRLRVV